MSSRFLAVVLFVAFLVIAVMQARASLTPDSQRPLADLETELAKLRKTETSLGQKLLDIENQLAEKGFPVSEEESVLRLLPPGFDSAAIEAIPTSADLQE